LSITVARVAQIMSCLCRRHMKTLTELKVEVRSRTQSELFELLRHCETRRHIWLELEGDSTSRGERSHYCRRCLRVRIVAGAEYWPAMPE